VRENECVQAGKVSSRAFPGGVDFFVELIARFDVPSSLPCDSRSL